MAASTLHERILAEHRELAAVRAAAGAAFQGVLLDAAGVAALPTARSENWKYANLRVLEKVRFSPAPPVRDSAAARSALPAAIGGFARIVFVDGRFAAELSDTLPVAAQLRQGTLAELPALPGADTDRAFARIGAAFGAECLELRAAPHAMLAVEVVFVTLADQQRGAAHPQLRIALEPNATAQLIERHVGHDATATFTNAQCQVQLGEHARLDHTRVFAQGPQGTIIDTLGANLAAGAAYELQQFSIGGVAARSTLQIGLGGRGASVALNAAALGSGSGVDDTFALIEHAAPQTRTVQNFRGIATGRSRVACNGHIVMRSAAIGAASEQSLRALLAGPGAEADLRPQLEIYTDDVKASHGATTGKLDEQQLFYLLSRGIERDTAEALLKWAFIEDVVARIGDRALRAQVEQLLAGRLPDLGIPEDAR